MGKGLNLDLVTSTVDFSREEGKAMANSRFDVETTLIYPIGERAINDPASQLRFLRLLRDHWLVKAREDAQKLHIMIDAIASKRKVAQKIGMPEPYAEYRIYEKKLLRWKADVKKIKELLGKMQSLVKYMQKQDTERAAAKSDKYKRVPVLPPINSSKKPAPKVCKSIVVALPPIPENKKLRRG